MELRPFVTSLATLALPKPAVYFAAGVQGIDGMGMRETFRSLRAYFMLSGLGAGIFVVIVALISVGFSLAVVSVGFTLPTLLRDSASRIGTLLYASAGGTVLCFLLSLLGGPSAFGLVNLILPLLILWYLLKNVRRRAAESQAALSEPPCPGD